MSKLILLLFVYTPFMTAYADNHSVYDKIDKWFEERARHFEMLENDPFFKDIMEPGFAGRVGVEQRVERDDKQVKMIITPADKKTELKIEVEDEVVRVSGDMVVEQRDDQGRYSKSSSSIRSSYSVPFDATGAPTNIERVDGEYVITFKKKEGVTYPQTLRPRKRKVLRPKRKRLVDPDERRPIKMRPGSKTI
jgi:hypothetical protein